MNKWNKVEKLKKPVSTDDIRWEYVKMVIWVLLGMTYLYFIFKG